MLATIIVGVAFLALLTWAMRRSHQSMKNKTCPGCAGSCSEAEHKVCQK